MKKRLFAYLLVFFQFASIAFLLTTAPVIADTVHGLLLEVAGIVLGLQAILTMRIGNFNIAPLNKPDGQLITSGIYSVIRHPMYLAQWLAMVGLVADYFDWWRLMVLLILTLTLQIKLHFEERQLKQHFAGYAEYTERTRKFIPYIY